MLGQPIFTPHRRIDNSTKAELEEKLLNFIVGAKHDDILVDFAGVEFVDGSGLMALLNGYKQAKSENKNFYLFNVSPAIRIILEISQLDQVLAVKDLNHNSSNQGNRLVA